LEETALGFLTRQLQRLRVRRPCFVHASEPTAAVGSGRVGELVVGQVSAREDGIDLLKVDTLTTAVDSLKALSAGGEAPRC